MIKKVIHIIFIAVIFFNCVYAGASTRDEMRAIEKIEELMLKGEYTTAKRKCSRFLRDYRTSRLRKKVKGLRYKCEKKVKGMKDIYEYESKTPPPEVTRVPASYTKTRAPEKKKQAAFYIVQVGAFKSKTNANKMRRSLKRKGFDAIIIKDSLSGRTLYKVRAGKFRELKNARRLVRNLKRKRFTAEIINEG